MNGWMTDAGDQKQFNNVLGFEFSFSLNHADVGLSLIIEI